MQGLARRFLFYFIGFGLGCVMVWAMFYKDTDRPAWMPEGRVLEFLEETPVEISKIAKCQLVCCGLSDGLIDSRFWEEAEVNFKESATQRKPCPEYKITSANLVIYVEVFQQQKRAKLRSVEQVVSEVECDCE